MTPTITDVGHFETNADTSWLPNKIDKGVPLPDPHRVPGGFSKRQQLFIDMEPGDSFAVPYHLRKTFAATAAVLVKNHFPDRKYSYRIENELWARMWRVK